MPCIAACAFGWNGGRWGDGAAVAVMLGFGATNGHVSALAMMAASRAGPVDAELAGFIIVAALHVGIVSGSNLALLILAAS